MNNEVFFGVEGKYKFEKCKVDENGEEISGSRVELTGWIDNIVTDAGLNLFGAFDGDAPITYMTQARVGAGSTTPAASDTGLVAQVATTTTIQATTNGVSGASPYYGYVRRTFRFGTGVAAGNLSEVGIFGGAGNTTCVSRALIVDNFNSPTTITILSDEVLDVVYEFRSYAPLVDISYGPISISGVDYSGTIRAANVNVADSQWTQTRESGMWGSSGAYLGGVGKLIYSHPSFKHPALSTQTLGAITSTVSGTTYFATSISATAYTSGTFYRDHEVFYDLNDGNISGGIGSMHILTSFGAFQISFTPKIDKDATKRLRMNFRVSWGRYTP